MTRQTGPTTAFQHDLAALWGVVGADSECGPLRTVLMHRPGPELRLVTPANFQDWLFFEAVDQERLVAQFDQLVEVYRSHGVDVVFVEGQREDLPNALFVRDLLFMATEGAILARPGHRVRRGEEKAVGATLARRGVPILRTVAGDGTFDGASALMVDRDLAVVAVSSRTNAEGADQVADQLARMGVSHVIRCAVPVNQIHLDGCMNVVDRRTVVINPWQMPFDAVEELRRLDVRIIEAEVLDAVPGMGINFVALAPGRVVMPTGYPASRRLLERHHIEAVEVDVSEIEKAGGAMHCLTGVIRRDPLD
jgi:arginine deiminase